MFWYFHCSVLFSAACNFIKVWKLLGTSNARLTNSSTIRHLGDLQLFKGDVLVTAMDDDCIYAATTDGVLHMWKISEALKNLSVTSLYTGTGVQAHEGRVISLVLHNDVVITAGHDGHIRVWCKLTLQMKAEAVAAHKGTKLHALTSTSTFLFSGGADKFVRVWDPETLAPVGEPVQAHATGVRSLASKLTSSSSILSSVQTTSPLEKNGSQLHSFDSIVWLVSGDAQGDVILWRFMTR